MEKGRAYLLGVAHVFDVKGLIKQQILSIAPSAVCIELDRNRYYALTHPQEVEEAKKDLPFIYRRLAKIQDSLGDAYGVQVGEEMLAAAEAARMIGAPLLLVDDDVSLLFKRMMKEMGWREKLRFFGALFLPSRKKSSVETEMKRYQEDEGAYIEELGRMFPTIKRLLIDERNLHMSERIGAAAESYGRVVAVLGDAHLEGIAKLLREKGTEVELLHLKDLRGHQSVTVRYSLKE